MSTTTATPAPSLRVGGRINEELALKPIRIAAGAMPAVSRHMSTTGG